MRKEKVETKVFGLPHYVWICERQIMGSFIIIEHVGRNKHEVNILISHTYWRSNAASDIAEVSEIAFCKDPFLISAE